MILSLDILTFGMYIGDKNSWSIVWKWSTPREKDVWRHFMGWWVHLLRGYGLSWGSQSSIHPDIPIEVYTQPVQIERERESVENERVLGMILQTYWNINSWSKIVGAGCFDLDDSTSHDSMIVVTHVEMGYLLYEHLWSMNIEMGLR